MNEEILKIWNDLNKALINFINQKVKNTEISKDISQDVFVKVFSKIDTLKNKDKIIPWIYQITRNQYLCQTTATKTKTTIKARTRASYSIRNIGEKFDLRFFKMYSTHDRYFAIKISRGNKTD